jgi:hypothetical protein
MLLAISQSITQKETMIFVSLLAEHADLFPFLVEGLFPPLRR